MPRCRAEFALLRCKFDAPPVAVWSLTSAGALTCGEEDGLYMYEKFDVKNKLIKRKGKK